MQKSVTSVTDGFLQIIWFGRRNEMKCDCCGKTLYLGEGCPQGMKDGVQIYLCGSCMNVCFN